jgi:3D (Asp-Asp-Asp) domain-containing protein
MLTSLFASMVIAANVVGPVATAAVAKATFEPVQVTAPAETPAPTQSVAPKLQSVVGPVVAVTAYTSEVGQTDSTPCIGADGTDLCKRYENGEKLCATNDHPMHSTLVVDGYGECTVVDRMNSRYTGTGHVDIYLGHDTPAAKQWGIRHLKVAIK